MAFPWQYFKHGIQFLQHGTNDEVRQDLFWTGTDVEAGVCAARVKGKGSSNIKQSNPIPHNMVQIKIKSAATAGLRQIEKKCKLAYYLPDFHIEYKIILPELNIAIFLRLSYRFVHIKINGPKGDFKKTLRFFFHKPT